MRNICLTTVIAVVLSLVVMADSPTPEQAAQEIQQAIEAAGAEWTAGVTWVSRLSQEEKRALCGDIDQEVPDALKRLLPTPDGATPTHFDWRDNGGDWTSPIRSQGACGSCWDFAATAVFEALINIDGADPTIDLDLSEQYVLSCCPTCGSCGGGTAPAALDFYCTTGGVMETCLPYQANDAVPCGDACTEPHVYLGDWAYIIEDVDAIKNSIYYYGPICAAFEVYEDFYSYVGGVYEHVWGDYLGGHAISIVGWDDAGQYWICKNSWDTGFGESGWFNIRWGECDIEGRRTVAATMTTWAAGTVAVTVLDGSGVGVPDAMIYVDGDYYGLTAPDGTLALDLIEGMVYTVTAEAFGQFLLYDLVAAPGSLVLDCRDASYVTLTAAKRDGSPMDISLRCVVDNMLHSPGATSGGSGAFYITPGVYDFQAWSQFGAEMYCLMLRDIDLTASTGMTVDASAMSLAQWRLDTLLDSSTGSYTYSQYAFADGFGWAVIWNRSVGESIFYNAGDWRVYRRLSEESSPPYTWTYSAARQDLTFTGGELFPVVIGGDLAHTAVPSAAVYEQGTTAQVRADLYDAFGNTFSNVSRYDSTGVEPPDRGAERPYEVVDESGSLPDGGTWDYFYPWLTVTPPTDPAIFDSQVYLENWYNVAIDAAAELGTHVVCSTIETHFGELEAISAFYVGVPTDPYEPNDPCEVAHDLGLFLPGDPPFASLMADHVDPNLDWFAVAVGAEGNLVIETTVIGSTCDTMLTLYDACGGTQLAYNDDGGVGLASQIALVVPPGTYVFKVDQYSQDYGPETEYTLAVELQQPPAPDPYDPNTTCETAYDLGPLPLDPPFASAVAHFAYGAYDWFVFSIGATALLEIETQVIGPDVDTALTLYDACGGSMLAYNDDGGEGYASRLEYFAAPGTYYLLIEEYSGIDGPNSEYTFTIGKIYVPSIAVVGSDPLIIQVPQGTTTVLDGLLEVANVGEEGSVLDYRILWQQLPDEAAAFPGDTASEPFEFPSDRTLPRRTITKDAAPTGDWDLLSIDPQDVPGSMMDFAELYAQLEGTILYFRVVTHVPWADPSDVAAIVFLDIDQNPATGSLYWPDNDLGFEYYLYWPHGYLLDTATGNTFPVDYVSAVADTNEFVIGIDLSKLTLDTGIGGIDLAFHCIDFLTEQLDWAPDAGEGKLCYPQPVPAVCATPDRGTIASGTSTPIGLQVDASEMSEGESCLIRLYFMSNDSTVVPTRDIEFRVGGTTPAVFTVEPTGDVLADGTFYAYGFLSGSADVAEWVNVSEPVEPGDVLELDPENPQQYRKARGDCLSLVAGVVSTRPGFTLGGETEGSRAIMALIGIVPVKACDEGGPIELGDLLAPASIPGYVRRWNPETDTWCPIVGKALAPLAQGEGLILVLLVR